jgi:predicted ferric reductase
VSKRLSSKQLNARVFKRLRKTDNLSFLEHFAMFMGKAQLVEMSLKKILADRYHYDEDRIERWTLGTTIKELEKCRLRKDFIVLLKELNEHRVHIAHNLLSDDALMRKLAGSEGQSFARKSLKRALYAVEAVIVVHDFLATNKYL